MQCPGDDKGTMDFTPMIVELLLGEIRPALEKGGNAVYCIFCHVGSK
jgi:hypothetical protein